jgi:hypothetical protein
LDVLLCLVFAVRLLRQAQNSIVRALNDRIHQPHRGVGTILVLVSRWSGEKWVKDPMTSPSAILGSFPVYYPGAGILLLKMSR